MKITAFNGSPAKEKSATGRIIKAFLKGAEKAGAEVELIHLADYHIKQCQGCFACWFKTPGKCTFSDDMARLLAKYQYSDIVCFGSPVYSWNMTALLKNFVDRLIPLKSPLIVQDNDKFDMADTMPREQKFVAVSNCGFPGENNFNIIKAAFSACNPSLEIYRNCGKLLTSQNSAVQNIAENYLQIVEKAGFEMVSDGAVSEATLQELDKPIMSIPEYVKFLGM